MGNIKNLYYRDKNIAYTEMMDSILVYKSELDKNKISKEELKKVFNIISNKEVDVLENTKELSFISVPVKFERYREVAYDR